MSIKQANQLKKDLNCLRCGRRMWTDRCHRICRRCHRANNREVIVEPLSVRMPGARDLESSDAFSDVFAVGVGRDE